MRHQRQTIAVAVVDALPFCDAGLNTATPIIASPMRVRPLFSVDTDHSRTIALPSPS